MLCWLSSLVCNTLLQCSHRSQEVFHSFFRISVIYHLLDFLNQVCTQNASCMVLHCLLSQTPMNVSCLICIWASSTRFPLDGQGVSAYQCSRAISSWWIIHGSVCCVFNHFVRSVRAAVQMHYATGSLHLTTCSLVSLVSVHWGHWADVQNFHHCIFFPWPKCPDTSLVTHCLLLASSEAIALLMTSQSMSLQTSSVGCHLVCQYCTEDSPSKIVVQLVAIFNNACFTKVANSLSIRYLKDCRPCLI